MVSQLLFGETYTILDEVEEWIYISCSFDSYRGWISKKQHTAFIFKNEVSTACLSSQLGLVQIDQKEIIVSAGASLPFESSNHVFFENIRLITGSINETSDHIKKYAYLFLHVPYLWGGRSMFGIDCSGFTQVVFKLMGISLPRDAYQQAEIGQTIAFIEESIVGDLAFFENELGKITHVGILLGDGTIIHASGRVRIDLIDHQGIYCEELKEYSHTLRLIKRVTF